jgi:bifunctional non-homologous end joining protein LigD
MITLYYREGSSDKIYQVAIEEQNGGFVVHYAYGRRGQNLTTGTKTSEPVTRKEAEKIFERLVSEKLRKGYREMGESVVSHTVALPENRGILPQLLNPMSEEELEMLLDAPNWLMQEKKDGRRLLLKKEAGVVTGINRRGLACGLPENIIQDSRALPGDWLIDGEIIGTVYHAFDLLEHDGSYRRHPLKERLVALLNLLASGQAPWIRFVPAITGRPMKRRFMDNCREEGLEGVVFKRIDSPYIPGRPNSGGDQRKYKFVQSASVVVTGRNGKRSVKMGLLDGERMVGAGNVTIPPGEIIPEEGKIIEVRYLYAFPESGALFQPVYLGERDDISREECTVTQLKFKAEAEQDEKAFELAGAGWSRPSEYQQ